MSAYKDHFRMMAKIGGIISHIVLLVIRVYWGFLFFQLGVEKMIHPRDTELLFITAQVPLPLLSTYAMGCIEAIGGITLVLGFCARFCAIPLIVSSIASYFILAPETLLHFFASPQLFITQDPFLFLYAAIIVLCFGSGGLSVDYWIEKKPMKRP